MEGVYRFIKNQPIKFSEVEKEVVDNKIIKKLGKFLDKGGNINQIFTQDFPFHPKPCRGTILHYAIHHCSKKVVEFVLSSGANVAIEIESKNWYLQYQYTLEIAAYLSEEPVFEILKRQSLELYSSYGLTPFHVDCAMSEFRSSEAKQQLQSADVNAAISIESPLWPGMTPVLIAAKLKRCQLVTSLLDRGADPFACDLKGNNPIHFLDPFDERLFAFDGEHRFSLTFGESHFHIACRYCPKYNTLNIVKRYLDQGTSPDLRKKSAELTDFDADKVALHTAVEKSNPELARLLLEYGADVDKKSLAGYTPLEDFKEWIKYVSDYENFLECICLLIEAGSNMERLNMKELRKLIIASRFDGVSYVFFECIKRLTILNKDSISKKLMDLYRKMSKQPVDGWDEAEYTGRCSQELEALFDLGLRQLLDGSITVKPAFKSRFEWLDNFDFESYPIYGGLLKMKYKRNLLELESKKRKIPRGVAKIQRLFRSLVHLPHLCADMILWNLGGKELDLFLAQ